MSADESTYSNDPRTSTDFEPATTSGITAPVIAFAISGLCGLGATIGIWGSASNTVIGLLLAGCLVGLGAGLVLWSNTLPIDREAVQMREDLSVPADEEAGLAAEATFTEETLGRRPVVRHHQPAVDVVARGHR